MDNQDTTQALSKDSTNPLVNSYMEASSSSIIQNSDTTMNKADIASTTNTMDMTNTANKTNTASTPVATANTRAPKTNQTIIGVFESRSDAESAVDSLRQQGFTNEEINIVSKKPQDQNVQSDDNIADGTLTGSTLGGIGGLLIGAGAIAIPGVAPIVALAGGPIGAAIGGAIAGGITGGLIDWGIPAEESEHYEEEVIQGSILAIIRTDSGKINSVAQILRQNGAKEVKSHRK